MADSAPIKAIVFDLGKVLVDFDWNLAVKRIVPFTSLNEDEIIPKVAETDFVKQFEEGQIDADDFAMSIIDILKADISIEEFSKFWAEIFIRRPEMEDLFVKVRKKYPVGILSDTSSIHWNYITELIPVISQPDALVLSYEIGSHKPDPRNYNQVIQDLGFDAEEIIFVDDLEENVEGAKKAGMQAFQFTTIPEVKKKIIKILDL